MPTQLWGQLLDDLNLSHQSMCTFSEGFSYLVGFCFLLECWCVFYILTISSPKPTGNILGLRYVFLKLKVRKVELSQNPRRLECRLEC